MHVVQHVQRKYVIKIIFLCKVINWKQRNKLKLCVLYVLIVIIEINTLDSHK